MQTGHALRALSQASWPELLSQYVGVPEDLTPSLPLDPYGATAGRKHMDGKPPRPKTVTVDLHNHMEIPAADAFIKPHLPAQENMNYRVSNPITTEITKKQFEIRRMAWRDTDTRLADMDTMDLDVMAVSCLPMQFYYTAPANAGHEASQMINDGIA